MDRFTTTASQRTSIVAVITGSHSGERFYESSPWIIAALMQLGHQVVRFSLDDPRMPMRLLGLSPHVVWPTGLGSGAEDGTVVGFLETLLPGTPYVGSSVSASALAMDKEASKAIFRALGFTVPDAVCFLPRLTPSGTQFRVSKSHDEGYLTSDGQPDYRRLAEQFGLPFVVKPCSAGASLGLTLVHDREEFEQVVVPTARRYGPILVEEYIGSPGADEPADYSVCLLEGEEPLPVYEICTPLYDTDQKIRGADYRPIDGMLAVQLSCSAWTIQNALGCRGFSRVDFRVTRQGTIYPLEINTSPGLIPEVSLFPRACSAIGLSYEQMIAHMLASADSPHRRAVPRVAAHEAPPFPEEFRSLLPELPADLQTPGIYLSPSDKRPAVSIAQYRC